MSRYNATSLLFAVVLLFSVMITTRMEREIPNESLADKVKITSFAAEAIVQKNILKEVITSPVSALTLRSESYVDYPKRIGGVADPYISAYAARISDLDSGEIFFDKNGDKNWSLASLTKLMTAVLAVERIGTDKVVPISETAAATLGIAGGFSAGELYSAGDLIRAMLVTSSNDAAAALAEFYGADRFVSSMNEKARSLGMVSTKFFDATGLSSLNQSNADDFLKLVAYIFERHPNLFEITRQSSINITNRSDGSVRSVSSTIKFAGRQDFLGGKTGYGEEGVANFIGIFTHANHRIVIIVLGALNQESRFREAEHLLNWLKQAYIF
jgi:D-alanyl-D-alanine carboxypeptidase